MLSEKKLNTRIKNILTPSSTDLSHKGPVPEYQDDRQSFLQNQLRVHPKMV